MRVTFKQVNDHMQRVINQKYSDLSTIQEQISTGKRLLRPSDAPVDVANDLKLREKMSQLEQYNKNIKDGKALMSVSDTAMMSMNDLMQRFRELAIQSSSDTVGPTERVYIQKEVEQLTRQIISLSNTQYKGDYIFAGSQTKTTPFPIAESNASTLDDYANQRMATYDASVSGPDVPIQIRNGFDGTPIKNIIPGTFKLVSPDSAGNTHTWVENEDYSVDYVNGTITILSGGSDVPALLQDVKNGTNPGTGQPNYSMGNFQITFENVTNSKNIYGDNVTLSGKINREIEAGISIPVNISGDELMRDPATGTDMLEVLIKFGEDLLQNDRDSLENTIEGIDNSLKNLLEAQSKNGARLNRFEMTLQRNELQTTETTRLFSEIEDVDFAETVSKFNLAETVYNAALSSAAKVLQPSLANFL